MKFPKEFTFSVKGDTHKIVITGCDLLDTLVNVSYLIQYIHGKFKGISPELVEGFRSMLVDTVQDPDSPCWEDVQASPGATEICFVMPKEDSNEA